MEISLKDEKINQAKKVLAYEVTKVVHGEEEAKRPELQLGIVWQGWQMQRCLNNLDQRRIQGKQQYY